MESSEATIEELPTGGVQRVAHPHIGRWTGLWIGLLGAIVGVAAFVPSSAVKPATVQGPRPTPDLGVGQRLAPAVPPSIIALAEPRTGDIETSGLVTLVGRNPGSAVQLVVTVTIGSLVLGQAALGVGTGESFAVRIPAATPIDGLALPATVTIADAQDGRVLAAQSIEVAGPPLIAWVAASTSYATVVEGFAPAGATRLAVGEDGCATSVRGATTQIGDPLVAGPDTRAALAAFGRTTWRAILPWCKRPSTIVARWSGVGGERGELYATVAPLNAETAPRDPRSLGLGRAPS